MFAFNIITMPNYYRIKKNKNRKAAQRNIARPPTVTSEKTNKPNVQNATLTQNQSSPKKTSLDKYESFDQTAAKVSRMIGSPLWFFFSVMLVVVWFFSGFFIGFEETWQLLINTATTIMTFLMMSLLHSSQSRWERDIEEIQVHQDKILKSLERKTTEIKSNLVNTENSMDPNAKTPANNGSSPKEVTVNGAGNSTLDAESTITSLF